jgi:hypothetical protein
MLSSISFDITKIEEVVAHSGKTTIIYHKFHINQANYLAVQDNYDKTSEIKTAIELGS